MLDFYFKLLRVDYRLRPQDLLDFELHIIVSVSPFQPELCDFLLAKNHFASLAPQVIGSNSFLLLNILTFISWIKIQLHDGNTFEKLFDSALV